MHVAMCWEKKQSSGGELGDPGVGAELLFYLGRSEKALLIKDM